MDATIDVDSRIIHQTMSGFGATTMALANSYDSLPYDTLGPLRPEAIRKLYQEVGINAGNLDITLHEMEGQAASYSYLNWTEPDIRRVEAMKTLLIDQAQPYGFNGYYFGKINTRWGSPWLRKNQPKNYDLFIDECAEYLVSIMLYWRSNHAIMPQFVMPFNEPLSGNGELAEGRAEDIANIVKRAGRLLQEKGFGQVKFVVPNEETEEKALESASIILADEEARQYVGAIGYHPYPYGSLYASVPNILMTSGSGKPDPGRIAIRQKLADLSKKYGIPLWMTEVSHPEVSPYSFEHLRGRAIHIHDELVYANVSAYYAMNNMWDLTTHRDHFKNDDIASEADTVVLVNNETGEVIITGMGYAIGHYARWIKPGSVRIEALSSDPLIIITAFFDPAKKHLVFVVVNNHLEDRVVNFCLQGEIAVSQLTGECSTGRNNYPTSYWQKLGVWQPESPQSFSARLPGWSVTSIAGLIEK